MGGPASWPPIPVLRWSPHADRASAAAARQSWLVPIRMGASWRATTTAPPKTACTPMSMAAQPLTSAAIVALPKELPGWSVVFGKLHRQFRFTYFLEAFGCMARVALAAEPAVSLISMRTWPAGSTGLWADRPLPPALSRGEFPPSPGRDLCES